ncbi:GLPGLI family protein [Lacinutrix jangbogonensis]|uniref:GLPGLI family protein n=1 Tax=Lacinutrix jangbogonensis TaxID=1469557 RepID=UPI00068B4CB4|nr:GLPGLI family protein [Lacinutrix jangbogonensis]
MIKRSLFFLFFINFCFAQSQSKEKVSVTYLFQNNSVANKVFEFDASFIADNTSSIYIVLSNTKSKIDENAKISEDDDAIVEKTIDISDGTNVFVYTNLLTKDIKHRSSIGNKSYKISEKISNFDWELIEEEKTIGNIVCYKAKTTYRGRDYIAWYAPSIQLMFGPWKFSGLPGLILEIYDTQKTFLWTAKSIKYPYKGSQELKEPESSNLMNITLKEFISKSNKSREKFFKIKKSKMPRGHKILKSETTRSGIELKYEWETDK